MEFGVPQQVSVEWILQNITSSSDNYNTCCCNKNWSHNHLNPCFCGKSCYTIDWEEMIYSKGTDDQIGQLLRIIEEEGFTIPISILYKKGFMIGNGHHRMSLAILLALDEIPVVFSDSTHYHWLSAENPLYYDFNYSKDKDLKFMKQCLERTDINA